MKFSLIELRDLTISIIILALAFSSFNLDLFPVTLFVIVLVFASHEILGHKLVAQKYGCFAEYKAWPLGLALGLVTAFLPFKFAAPGAVYISPVTKEKFAFKVVHLTKREYRLISLAGPLVNLIVGFSLVFVNVFLNPIAFYKEIFILTSQVSFFLAFFNLLPVAPLDGEKILNWNKRIWIVVIVLAIAGYFVI